MPVLIKIIDNPNFKDDIKANCISTIGFIIAGSKNKPEIKGDVL